jgi:hypothetical protein
MALGDIVKIAEIMSGWWIRPDKTFFWDMNMLRE